MLSRESAGRANGTYSGSVRDFDSVSIGQATLTQLSNGTNVLASGPSCAAFARELMSALGLKLP